MNSVPCGQESELDKLTMLVLNTSFEITSL